MKIEPNYYEVLPSAGINASISDMVEWLQLLLGNRPHIASEALLDAVYRIVAPQLRPRIPGIAAGMVLRWVKQP